jgi:hypothetical protein
MIPAVTPGRPQTAERLGQVGAEEPEAAHFANKIAIERARGFPSLIMRRQTFSREAPCEIADCSLVFVGNH